MKLEVLINALAYELGLFFSNKNPILALQPWFKRLMDYCRPDWLKWKTGYTMADVDRQIEEIQQRWAAEEAEKQKPIYSELPPDDSEAQSLLGGEMRLTAPWYNQDQSTTNQE